MQKQLQRVVKFVRQMGWDGSIKLLIQQLKRPQPAIIALGVALLAVVGGVAWWTVGSGAVAQNPPRERAVAVLVGKAVRKDLPYRVEAPGSVQPVVGIAVRSRVESQVVKVHFEDGAAVKEGDLLYTLDTRTIDAQIRQAEATLARDKASLDKANRDVERYEGLVAKKATAQVTLDDARTAAEVLKATIKQDEANLDNLRVQRTYYDIQSPVTGRVGVSGVRSGSVVRPADTGGTSLATVSTSLVTVNQISPIYVGFGVPERYIPDLRAAGAKATVNVTLQNGASIPGGNVANIDNTVDPQTGTIMVRALFDNGDEQLWPGTLASVRVTLRTELGVVAVPNEAIQNGQRGTFVFVVENNTAKVRLVTVARTVDGEAVVTNGLAGDETVVTDGQLSLRDGSRIEIKRAAGA
jgi:RND family efflux transporter MFP subunit